MADLTLEDLLKPQIKVSKIDFAGKTGHVRDLSFDAQMELARKFSGQADKEATADDMKVILGHALCDSEGKLLFADPRDAIQALGNWPASELVELFNKVQSVNGMDVEEEVKN